LNGVNERELSKEIDKLQNFELLNDKETVTLIKKGIN